MDENKFEKAAEKARSKGKNRTPKQPTQHQLKLAEERKGLEALKEVEVPTPAEVSPELVEVASEPVAVVESDDPVQAALNYLESLPAYSTLKQAGELKDRVTKLIQEQAEAEKNSERLLKEIGGKVIAMQPIQKDYGKELEKIRAGVLGDPKITFQHSLRNMLKGDFSKVVDAAVQYSVSKSSAVVELQQNLAKRTAEIEQLKAQEAAAKNRIRECREQADALTKEADALLASISL
jgi:chromosome segregation ATPase